MEENGVISPQWHHTNWKLRPKSNHGQTMAEKKTNMMLEYLKLTIAFNVCSSNIYVIYIIIFTMMALYGNLMEFKL